MISFYIYAKAHPTFISYYTLHRQRSIKTLSCLRPVHLPPFERRSSLQSSLFESSLVFARFSKFEFIEHNTTFVIFRKTIPENNLRNSERAARRNIEHALSDEKHERATSPYLHTSIFEHTNHKLSINLCQRDNGPSSPTRSGFVEKVSCSPSIQSV